MGRFWLAAALLLHCLSARAETPPSQIKAQTHFQVGAELFKSGSYAAALREFEAGYALSPRPEFLINMASTHAKLGHRNEARKLYERYLVEAPKSPFRREVVRRIATLESTRQADDEEVPLLTGPSAGTMAAAPESPSPAPESGPGGPTPSKTSSGDRSRQLLIAGGTLLGVGVIGIATGGGLLGAARNLNDELGTTGSTWSSSKASRRDSYWGGGVATLAIGTAAAVAGTALTAIALSSRRGVTVQAGASGDGGTFTLGGTF